MEGEPVMRLVKSLYFQCRATAQWRNILHYCLHIHTAIMVHICQPLKYHIRHCGRKDKKI